MFLAYKNLIKIMLNTNKKLWSFYKGKRNTTTLPNFILTNDHEKEKKSTLNLKKEENKSKK